jgi:hypothetical protein
MFAFVLLYIYVRMLNDYFLFFWTFLDCNVLWLDFIINLIILGMQIPEFPNSHGGRGAFLPLLGRDMRAHHFPCGGFAARGLPPLAAKRALNETGNSRSKQGTDPVTPRCVA